MRKLTPEEEENNLKIELYFDEWVKSHLEQADYTFRRQIDLLLTLNLPVLAFPKDEEDELKNRLEDVVTKLGESKWSETRWDTNLTIAVDDLASFVLYLGKSTQRPWLVVIAQKILNPEQINPFNPSD